MMRKSFLMLAMTVLTFAVRAEAQLRIFAGGAMTEAVKKVDADFAKKAGHEAEVTSDTSGALQKKIEAGGKADVLIISASNMSALEKEHLIVPRTRIDLAKGLIGVAVRAGANVPDLSSPESFKKVMLAAKSVSYVDPKAGGTSGTYMAGLFHKMGIAEEMEKKTVFRNQGAEVADAVAKGDAEVGITFTSEMIASKGVKIAGTLPIAIQLPTIYAGAVPASASNPGAGRAFLQAMYADGGYAAIKETGLEPLRN